MVRNLKAKYEGCFCRLQCNKIDPANAVTSEAATNSRNNVFRSKEISKKTSPNKFGNLAIRKNVGFMF